MRSDTSLSQSLPKHRPLRNTLQSSLAHLNSIVLNYLAQRRPHANHRIIRNTPAPNFGFPNTHHRAAAINLHQSSSLLLLLLLRLPLHLPPPSPSSSFLRHSYARALSFFSHARAFGTASTARRSFFIIIHIRATFASACGGERSQALSRVFSRRFCGDLRWMSVAEHLGCEVETLGMAGG